MRNSGMKIQTETNAVCSYVEQTKPSHGSYMPWCRQIVHRNIIEWLRASSVSSVS